MGKYDFTETARFLATEGSVEEIKREVLTTALELSRVGCGDAAIREKAVQTAQLTALFILDLLDTIAEK